MIEHDDHTEQIAAKCRPQILDCQTGNSKMRRTIGIVLSLLTLGVAGVALLGYLTTNSLIICREDATRIRCASHLKQIGLALQMYSMEHAGQLPPSFDELILHVDIATDVFVCPQTRDSPAVGTTLEDKIKDFHNPGHCSYIYVAANLSTDTLTPNHILAYESLANNAGDGINVLMSDGHAEWYGKARAIHTLAELQSGHNPPRPMPNTMPTTR